ncbi:hypothetical protein RHS04_06642 [Rhizoctonia solani]|uniref:RanBP2-type domain-containing protein n=1 Tax=Rhizoctonia solani TaxID=456999 RepID=A0A8H7H7C9_9AGAM|nr:hypothetical protein RHS04_06642 [Rhizoctonia solani]
MATRRENGMGSMLRRKQRSEHSSPYKRRHAAPTNNKLQSSSSLSSFLSFISGAFRRKPERVEPESEQSEDGDTTGTDLDEQPESDPELGPRYGRRIERDNKAADSLSRLGQTLQQSAPKPKVLPPSSILPSADSGIKTSASTSHIAPPTRPRRAAQPSFATVSRTPAKRPERPIFPGGIKSFGGLSPTAEPSSPPFTSNNPLENSFAANRPPTSKFTFVAKPPSETAKTSSEILADFFASKGKAPLTAAERKHVAQLIAASDAESSKSQSPDADPYNGVPSFSFLKATFPAPERDSTSPSSSLQASESAPSIGSSVAPRKRRPINYGGVSKRSAAITKAGFTLREHQKLLEKQKATQENVAPDLSSVGDKRGVRDAEEDGGGKRRRTNDGQSAAAEEPAAKTGVTKLLNLNAQPSMPSPLRQMTKLNSPSPPRTAPRAQAPSPASPLSRNITEEVATPKATAVSASIASPSKPASSQTTAKPKARKSLVADVMRDMLAEDKAREKQEKPVDTTVFANPYEDNSVLPAVTAPKVRKPRRTSARPTARSSASVAKQESKPKSLIEKIEQTDVRPSAKKTKTDVDASTPGPKFTVTAATPKDTTPKARRPAPVVEEPSVPTESSEIEVIDMDEELKHKSNSNGRPALSVDVANNNGSNGSGNKANGMLGLPHRQRPSFSLHSPARPSPLREMSVPIEDEEDEIVEIPGPTNAPFTNGFHTSANVFPSTTPFSNGFPTNTSSNIFSAPVPPSAPTTTPAQLPNKTQAPKIDAPLFGPSKPLAKPDTPLFSTAPKPAESKLPEPKSHGSSLFAAPKPTENKTEVLSFFKPSKPVETKHAPVAETKPAPAFAPARAPVAEVKPTPAPVLETKPTPAPKATPSKPLSETELKASAQTVPVSELPVFTFTAPIATSTPKTTEARTAANLPISKLPVFTFGSLAPAPATKTASFNWGAAGVKAPSASSGASWTCDVCMLSNPASATEKCTVCDAKKPGASAAPALAPVSAPSALAPAAKTASFDWGAAGMKAPTTPATGSWTCATCSLSNPASATDKCTVCDAKKPGAAPATKAASFDWGAAGMKTQATSTAGQWTCSTCSLSNPATATEKCTVCDAKKPGAAPPTKTASFNWGAAGMKLPTASGAWTCSTCGLSNSDASATKCSICDASR